MSAIGTNFAGADAARKGEHRLLEGIRCRMPLLSSGS
jgi:hypothetical protein